MGGTRDCNHFVLICKKSPVNQIQTTSKVWQRFSKVMFEVSLHFFYISRGCPGQRVQCVL